MTVVFLCIGVSLGLLSGCVNSWEPPVDGHQTAAIEVFWDPDHEKAISGINAWAIVSDNKICSRFSLPYSAGRGLLDSVDVGEATFLVVSAAGIDGSVLFSDTLRLSRLVARTRYYVVIGVQNNLDTLRVMRPAKSNSDSMYVIGRIYYDQEFYRSSAVWMSRARAAVALEPQKTGEPEILYYLGRSWYELSMFDSAVTTFRSYLSIYPEGRLAGNTWYFLGRSYYKMSPQDARNAADCFMTLISRDPGHAYTLDSRYYAGRSYYFLGDYDSARILLKSFLSLAAQDNSRREDASYYLARCDYLQSKYAESIPLFLQFLATYPASNLTDAVRIYLAKAYFYTGLPDSGVTICTKVINEGTDTSMDIRAEAYLVRGKCLMQDTDSYVAAAKDFQVVLQSFPTYSGCDESQYLLGMSYYERAKINQSSYSEARTQLKLVEEKYPGSSYVPGALYYIGLSCRYMKEYAAAVDTFKSLITRFPQSSFCDNGYYYLIKSIFSLGSGKPNSECLQAREYLVRMQAQFPETNQYLIDAQDEYRAQGCQP